RAPHARVLLRAFAGGMLNPDAYTLPDGELIARSLCDLGELLGIAGDPEEAWLTRFPASMPQYEVGHPAHIAHLEQALPENLALAGNAHHGVGIPDCLATGFAAADRLLELP
ncbi:MAG: FAD-dependent oxidoreductase, partial [Chloroflexota bacterium]